MVVRVGEAWLWNKALSLDAETQGDMLRLGVAWGEEQQQCVAHKVVSASLAERSK